MNTQVGISTVDILNRLYTYRSVPTPSSMPKLYCGICVHRLNDMALRSIQKYIFTYQILGEIPDNIYNTYVNEKRKDAGKYY